MKTYKLKYKKVGAPRILLFESESFDKAKDLARRYCKEFKFQLVQVIDEYMDLEQEILKHKQQIQDELDRDRGKKEKQAKAAQAQQLKKAS